MRRFRYFGMHVYDGHVRAYRFTEVTETGELLYMGGAIELTEVELGQPSAYVEGQVYKVSIEASTPTLP